MRDLLSAETVKLSRRRLPWVLAGIVILLTIVNAVFQFLATEIFSSPEFDALAAPEKPEAYLQGFVQSAGNSWMPVILAVVMLGGEFSKGTWATSLTWESRRWLHLLTKLVAFGLTAAVISLISLIVWSVFTAGLADGSGFPGAGELTSSTLKLGFVVFVWVAIGLAAVAVIRSTGLAVGLAIGLTFVEQLLALWPAYQDLSIGGATTGIFGLELPDVLASNLALPNPTRSAAILAVWGLVSVVVAWAALTYRDA